MLLSWPYLVLALVLLWTPLVRCLGRTRRRSLLQAESSHRIPALALLRVGWNWLDLARAGAGAWVLVHHAILPPLDPKADGLPSIIVPAVVLAVGVIVQAVGSSHDFSRLLAPVFYLLGISAALLPWQGAVFGGLLALVLAEMLGGWIHLFWLMPITLAVALYLFENLGLSEILIASQWCLPLAFRLVVPSYSCLWVLARIRTETVDRGQSPVAGGQSTVAGGRLTVTGGPDARSSLPAARDPAEPAPDVPSTPAPRPSTLGGGKLPAHPSDARPGKPKVKSGG